MRRPRCPAPSGRATTQPLPRVSHCARCYRPVSLSVAVRRPDQLSRLTMLVFKSPLVYTTRLRSRHFPLSVSFSLSHFTTSYSCPSLSVPNSQVKLYQECMHRTNEIGVWGSWNIPPMDKGRGAAVSRIRESFNGKTLQLSRHQFIACSNYLLY